MLRNTRTKYEVNCIAGRPIFVRTIGIIYLWKNYILFSLSVAGSQFEHQCTKVPS